MQCFRFFSLVGFLGLLAPGAFAQVVQLPTAGTFHLSSSIAVPDSGSGSLGVSSFGRTGASSRGPMSLGGAHGSSLGGGETSVHATVIDLVELDSMIRSQSGKTTMQPSLKTTDPRESGRKRAAARGRIDNADYDYLIALSRSNDVDHRGDPDAVAYFLGMAEQARSRGTWSAVELYYKMAWKNLPPARREAALLELAKARASGKKADHQTISLKKPK